MLINVYIVKELFGNSVEKVFIDEELAEVYAFRNSLQYLKYNKDLDDIIEFKDKLTFIHENIMKLIKECDFFNKVLCVIKMEMETHLEDFY